MKNKQQELFCVLKYLFIIGILFVGMGYYCIFHPNVNVRDEGLIYIPQEQSVVSLFDTLRRRGYIENRHTLSITSKLKRYTSVVKSGKYKIIDKMNNHELINLFRSGNQIPIQLTFNNIRTLEEFADIVSQQLNFSKNDLLNQLKNNTIIDLLGFTSETFISMFIPNTYEMYWNISIEDFLKRMKKEYHLFWNKQRLDKAREIGLSPIEVSILASIIEEETTKKEEYPIIAGVYLNRLKQGIKLDACPTLKFILGDFSIKRILHRYLEIDSPYNTYKYAGLPPGPIRMASIQVIDGVLNREKHDYFYFCAKSDFSGYHHFSRTLHQHNVYAQKYHQELNRRKIWK